MRRLLIPGYLIILYAIFEEVTEWFSFLPTNTILVKFMGFITYPVSFLGWVVTGISTIVIFAIIIAMVRWMTK